MHKYILFLFAILRISASQATDIAVNIIIRNHELEVNGQTTCTIILINEGATTTGPITVALNFSPGTEVLAHKGNIGKYNIITQQCEFTGFAVNESQKSIELTLIVKSEGPSIITAEVIKMGEKDIDSTPANGVLAEDDMKFDYISVPIMFCSNENIKLQAQALAGHSNYTWYRDGVIMPNENKETITITAIGKYTYIVPNTKAGTDYYSAPVIIGKRSPSTLVQLALGDNINTCAGEYLKVNANASNGTPPYSYKWSNDLNWDLSKPLKALMQMKLTCIVTDKNGCRNTDSIKISVGDCKKTGSLDILTSQN